jgi:DNA integrity scanning protein DisA with diadenylate cyclase activity
MSAKPETPQKPPSLPQVAAVKPGVREETPAAPSGPPKPKGSKRSLAESYRAFLKDALALARHLQVDHVLYASDAPPPIEQLVRRSVKKLIVVATHSEKIAASCEEEGLRTVLVPAYAFDRFEKIKVALAACVSGHIMETGDRVLCLAGPPHSDAINTCLFTHIGEDSEERAALSVLGAGQEFAPQVLEAVLNIALTIGHEGFEGAPVGTIFVVGDCTTVMEKSRQLTLNPFQGYSEDERNILDPRVREAIKNFCLLDGSFVIREDGVVLAAGRYLQSPRDLDIDLPLGLGTRNAAAMTVTKVSRAIAFVVSKTSGAVRVYKNGELALELKQSRRRLT